MVHALYFAAGFIAFPLFALVYLYCVEVTKYLRDERTQPWKGK